MKIVSAHWVLLTVVWARTETTVSVVPREAEPAKPQARVIKLKAMAPPPVPVKKRTELDDLLGAEVDAIEKKRPKISLKPAPAELPFRPRRAKALLATLKADPNAYLVSEAEIELM